MNPATFLSITFGSAVLGWLMGCGAALVWFHPFVTFAAFLAIAMVSLRLHAPNERVVGAAVDAVQLVRAAA